MSNINSVLCIFCFYTFFSIKMIIICSYYTTGSLLFSISSLSFFNTSVTSMSSVSTSNKRFMWRCVTVLGKFYCRCQLFVCIHRVYSTQGCPLYNILCVAFMFLGFVFFIACILSESISLINRLIHFVFYNRRSWILYFIVFFGSCDWYFYCYSWLETLLLRNNPTFLYMWNTLTALSPVTCPSAGLFVRA